MSTFFLFLFILPSFSYNLVAHRGVHHTYGPRMANGCRSYLNFRHGYVENTLASVSKAFEYGAEKVEVDLMVSKDGKVFLFHDEDLRCHLGLDKKAPETSWSEIAPLDPAYAVTFDEGKTFPLRGSGQKIPLLEELFRSFPGKSFLLNPKLYSPVLTKNLILALSALPTSQRASFWFWGDQKTFMEVHAAFPEIDTFLEIPHQHQNCIDDYFVMGWYGEFPKSCQNRHISLGEDGWWMIWDWPFPFLLLAQKHNLKISLWLGNRIRHARVYENWPVEGVTISNIDLQK